MGRDFGGRGGPDMDIEGFLWVWGASNGCEWAGMGVEGVLELI